MEKIRSIRRMVSLQIKRMVPEYYMVEEAQSVMVVEFTREDLLSLQESVSYGRPKNQDVMEALRAAWNGKIEAHEWIPERFRKTPAEVEEIA